MSAGRASASDSGFVLVGVVVFVLALAILVLSLYGLSSYEAQFFQRSLDEEQAFQSAVGGIERAKFALTRTSQLASVKDSLPENVTATVAIQEHGSVSDSTGALNWQGTDVTIRVTAEVNGARRMVEGRFSPTVTLSYYSQLITVRRGVSVLTTASGGSVPHDRLQTVLLDGPVWESSSQDTNSWKPSLCAPAPLGIRKSPAVPPADVAPLLATASGATLAVQSGPVTDPVYTLDASGTPGFPRYFRAQDTDENFSFTSFPRPSCTIQVRGMAVWLLPRGAMFYEGTVITGDPATDCLVVIAGRMEGTFGPSPGISPRASICFLGFMRADIPVVLVSNGKVLFWHENDWDRSTMTTDLAIFARSVEFMGPWRNPPDPEFLQLHRYPSGPLNTFFLDALANQGALPNASSASGKRLDLVPGSWQASDR
jgi:hypothetical protein